MLDRLRRAVLAALAGTVDEAVGRHYARHQAELAALRAEVAELRAALQDGGRGGEQDRQPELLDRRDVFAEWEREAAAQSAEFVREHMAGARSFDDPRATLEYALRLAPSGGLALEFGVYTGSTLNLVAAARADGRVFGFDSAGHWSEGTADVSGAELLVGPVEETLPRFLAEHPEQVDFVHVDSDRYSSAATVLEQVGPRLRAGSVLVFDEFFNFPGWDTHERQAWSEYVARKGVSFRYEAYTHDNEQVVVRLTSG